MNTLNDDDAQRRKEIEAYYDDFTHGRFASYQERPNFRHIAALTRILPHIAKDAHVLEVGCGAGILTGYWAARAADGHVSACDISSEAVKAAEELCKANNVKFKAIDVVHDGDLLTQWSEQPVNIIILVDVLGHIPVAQRSALFKNLCANLADGGAIALTFPSELYQRYMREHEPDELQIVDEIITVGDIQSLCEEFGLSIKHYSLEDVWQTNQYTHCVLERNVALRPMNFNGQRYAMAEHYAEYYPVSLKDFLRLWTTRQIAKFTRKAHQ